MSGEISMCDVFSPRDQSFEPCAPFGERFLADILAVLDQQIVGAQVRRKVRGQFRVDGFAVEPLLQHVERLHAAVAHDQKLAVDRAVEIHRMDEIGKRAGDVLAGARIKPRDALTVRFARHRLHADAVPFPFRREVRRIERGEVRLLDRVAQHHGMERRRIDVHRLLGAAFDPGEQLGVGRREAGPHQFHLVRRLVAERRDRGLGKPRRHADAQRAGDEFQQRPAPGLVERIEPGGELRGQFGFAERGERGDDVGEGRARLSLGSRSDERVPPRA